MLYYSTYGLLDLSRRWQIRRATAILYQMLYGIVCVLNRHLEEMKSACVFNPLDCKDQEEVGMCR